MFVFGGIGTTIFIILSFFIIAITNFKVFTLENNNISKKLREVKRMIIIIPTHKWKEGGTF